MAIVGMVKKWRLLVVLLGLLSLCLPGAPVALAQTNKTYIGTARAFQVSPIAGTFAGIALGLNGLLTALLVPVVIHWLVK